jgi:glycosyltransferase involved in cell wall biosynthesis
MKPLVSICIPTYNREKTILDALNCALNQTYQNIEILISEDHSSDHTAALVKKIKDPRIKLVVQKKNLGMIPNWNFCIQRAKGEYIKFLHSDDLIDPTCVEKEFNYFLKNEDVSLVTCKRKFIDDHDKLLYTMQFANKNTKENGREYGHKLLTTIRENRIGEPSAVMFRKVDAIKAGLFDQRFSQLADFEFWLRLHLFGNIGYINESLCSFRMHQGSNTTAAIKDGRFIDETFVFIEKFYENDEYRKAFKLTQKDKAKVIRMKTQDFLKNVKILFISGDLKTARIYLNKLVKFVTIPEIFFSSVNHLLQK